MTGPYLEKKKDLGVLQKIKDLQGQHFLPLIYTM